eukprot:Lithocolla_globosa_v1_NODE_570_length_3712_cov_22.282199.p2 type:complete len:345 gc:universal NODE_570_length_3712_cov_22.282199:2499-3533(+)
MPSGVILGCHRFLCGLFSKLVAAVNNATKMAARYVQKLTYFCLGEMAVLNTVHEVSEKEQQSASVAKSIVMSALILSYALVVTPAITYENRCVTSCPNGTYTSFTGDDCYKCHSTCLTCDAYGPYYCLLCEPDLVLVDNACLSECPVGYSFVESVCVACSFKCDFCSSHVNCTSCSDGYLLFEAQCVAQCPLGYILSGKECLSKCPNNLYLNPQGNGCITDCPRGYGNGDSECFKCSQHCDECIDAQTCSQCDLRYHLFNNTCVEFCPNTTYSSFIGDNCDVTCLTCSSSGPCGCTSCETPRQLQNNACSVITVSPFPWQSFLIVTGGLLLAYVVFILFKPILQ